MLQRMLTGIFLFCLSLAPVNAAVLKIATVAPEGSQWMRDMRAGAAQIKERTDGRVILKLYGGGVMGNDKQVLRKIRLGQLQGGVFVASALAERYPDMNLYGLPLLFESIDEVDYVRERMDQRLIDGLREAGYISFGFAGGGFALLMSNVPVRSLSNLEGQKVWVPEGDIISYAAMEALGLAPVTLPITDVLTGLQTGLIDIIATSPVGAVVLQWHTKVRYVTDLPVSYLTGTLVVQRRAFERLSEEDRAVVHEVMSEIYRNFDQGNRADDMNAAQALRDSGLQYVDPDPAEVPQWRSIVSAANREQAEKGAFSAALLDELLGYLADVRDGAASHARVDATQ